MSHKNIESKLEIVEVESETKDSEVTEEIIEEENIIKEKTTSKKTNETLVKKALKFFIQNKVTAIILCIGVIIMLTGATMLVIKNIPKTENKKDNQETLTAKEESKNATDYTSCVAEGGLKNLQIWPEECVTINGTKFVREFTEAEKADQLLQTQKVHYKSISFPSFEFDYNKSWNIDLNNIAMNAYSWDYSQKNEIPVSADDNGRSFEVGSIKLNKGSYQIEILLVPYWPGNYIQNNENSNFIYPCNKKNDWNKQITNTIGRVNNDSFKNSSYALSYAYLNDLSFLGSGNFSKWFDYYNLMYGGNQSDYFSCANRTYTNGSNTGWAYSKFVYKGIPIQAQVFANVNIKGPGDLKSGLFTEADEIIKSFTSTPSPNEMDMKKVQYEAGKCYGLQLPKTKYSSLSDYTINEKYEIVQWGQPLENNPSSCDIEIVPAYYIENSVYDASDIYYPYAKSSKYVYFGRSILEGMSPSSFSPLDLYYSKDAKVVYFRDKKVEYADANTFKVLDSRSEVAKDKNYVFYNGRHLTNIDVNSFQVLKCGYAKDKNNVYYNGKTINGADSETFMSICLSEFPKINGITYNAKDKNNYYLYDKIVATVAPIETPVVQP